jgi:hypothetical protein
VALVAAAIAWVLAGVLPDPSGRMVGLGAVDAYGTQWFYAWVGDVVRGVEPLARTTRLFHPWGKEVFLHTGGNLLDAVAAWPFRAAFGLVGGYNAWIAALLASNAWAAARAAAALGVPGGSRWPAALAVTLHPFVLHELELGRPAQAWLALPLLAFSELVALRTPGGAVRLGVAVALTGYQYWFHGFALGACAVAWGATRLIAGDVPRGRPHLAGLLVLSALVAAATVAPFAAPLIAAARGGDIPGLLALDGTGPLAPLALRTVEGEQEGLAVFAAAWGGMAGGLDAGELPGSVVFTPDTPIFGLGWSVLLAVGLAAWRPGARGSRRSVLAWCLVAVVLATGPAWAVADGVVANRPYLWLVGALDFLRRWWWPVRAVALLVVVAAPLVAVVVARLPGPAWARGAALACVLGVPLARDSVLPLSTWDGSDSDVLACIRDAPAGAVIDVPWASDQDNLWLQVLHGRPVLGGMMVTQDAFQPPEVRSLRARNGLLRGLDAAGDRDALSDVPADARQELRALGYRWVLLRASGYRLAAEGGGWESAWDAPLRRITEALGPPVAADARLAAWSLAGDRCPVRSQERSTSLAVPEAVR